MFTAFNTDSLSSTRLDLDGSGVIDYTEFCAAGIGERISLEVDKSAKISCCDIHLNLRDEAQKKRQLEKRQTWTILVAGRCSVGCLQGFWCAGPAVWVTAEFERTTVYTCSFEVSSGSVKGTVQWKKSVVKIIQLHRCPVYLAGRWWQDHQRRDQAGYTLTASCALQRHLCPYPWSAEDCWKG